MCLLQKIYVMDMQLQNLEQATFYGRVARQHNALLVEAPEVLSPYLQSYPQAARGDQKAPPAARSAPAARKADSGPAPPEKTE